MAHAHETPSHEEPRPMLPARAGARRVMRSSWAPRMAGALTVLAILSLLQGLIGAGFVNRFLVPPPTTVLASLPILFLREGLVERFAATFAETFAAALLAAIVGILAGWALYRWRMARRAYLGWVVGIAAAP